MFSSTSANNLYHINITPAIPSGISIRFPELVTCDGHFPHETEPIFLRDKMTTELRLVFDCVKSVLCFSTIHQLTYGDLVPSWLQNNIN